MCLYSTQWHSTQWEAFATAKWQFHTTQVFSCKFYSLKIIFNPIAVISNVSNTYNPLKYLNSRLTIRYWNAFFEIFLKAHYRSTFLSPSTLFDSRIKPNIMHQHIIILIFFSYVSVFNWLKDNTILKNSKLKRKKTFTEALTISIFNVAEYKVLKILDAFP